MPYKVFVAGEEALAADANSYLMSQTVARFTNATQRTSQLTAPVLNQLSALDTAKGVPDYWDGAGWKPLGVSLVRHFSQTFGGSVTTAQEISISAFTMPVTGTIVLQGISMWNPYPAGGATFGNMLTDVGPTSTPAAASSPQFQGPTFQAQSYYAAVPFVYRWANVSAGTAVNLKVRYSANAGGAVLSHHDGLILIGQEF